MGQGLDHASQPPSTLLKSQDRSEDTPAKGIIGLDTHEVDIQKTTFLPVLEALVNQGGFADPPFSKYDNILPRCHVLQNLRDKGFSSTKVLPGNYLSIFNNHP